MGLFTKVCKHKWRTDQRSNVLQLDSMGYPLRLFICKCANCGVSDQKWIDVPLKEAKELDTGESVLLKWQ